MEKTERDKIAIRIYDGEILLARIDLPLEVFSHVKTLQAIDPDLLVPYADLDAKRVLCAGGFTHVSIDRVES